MRTPAPRHLRSSSGQKVQVFCRVKPNSTDLPSCIEIINETTLKTVGSRAGSYKETLHTFSAVYDDQVSQDVIFQNVALPLVGELLEGKNGLLLTYGTTGSGKTYAMQGTSKEAGILPLALEVLFNSLGDRQTKKYVVKPDGINGFVIQSETDALMDRHHLDYQQRLKLPRNDVLSTPHVKSRASATLPLPSKALYAVFISLVEVYNNNIYDLLRETPDIPGRPGVTHALREDAHRNIYVSGCVEAEVKTVDEALKIFAAGQKRRRIGQTALNCESSRSHCVFTIRLVRTGYDEKYDEAIENKDLLVVSQLCLVDLAGSERANRAGTQGDRLKEASNINSSLMNLRKCIEVLREIQSMGQSHLGLATPGGTTRVVPYRDTRLTHLFKTYFEGSGRVVMLVCIRQSVADYDETMHVLKFAETSQEVSTFRTPILRARSPAPFNSRSTRTQAVCASGRSTDSGDTTSSITMAEEHMNSILLELANYNTEIKNSVSRLLKDDYVSNSGFDLEEILARSPISGGHTSDEVEQDSAPEPDRQRTRLCKIDTEPLRALIAQRMECRQRACTALDRELNTFRLVLMDLTNNESPKISHGAANTDVVDRARLEARIRKLEGQLVETSAATKRERADHTKRLEEYRLEIQRLRDELQQLLDARLSAREPTPTKRRLRPSMSQPNIVSMLSRQWENRVAEQEAAKLSSTRRVGHRQAISNNKSSHRVAAFNPRHRRSRSAGGDGGVWLEHQESIAAPLGTIFTPRLKNRKSVTQLELKDTLKASNYLLHHQEATPDGNIETKLYKGSIIPTAGGGSAVIFNDVEELRQASPLSDKRISLKENIAPHEAMDVIQLALDIRRIMRQSGLLR
ncbi:Kinesin-like protein kif23 [Clonorchis sinensis]|uniref:Kinesin-like protein n=1 Tax=Clonorchis sinensis TaxID=79923 RepID=A0A8T1MH22_CLOSI|nr:Kinesin-like protein kif23 [Clonorchis sinensis]